MAYYCESKECGQSNGKEYGQDISGYRNISLRQLNDICKNTGGAADGGDQSVHRGADAQAADSGIVAGGGQGWRAAADARIWTGGCGAECGGDAGDGLSDSVDHQDVRGQRDDDASARGETVAG